MKKRGKKEKREGKGKEKVHTIPSHYIFNLLILVVSKIWECSLFWTVANMAIVHAGCGFLGAITHKNFFLPMASTHTHFASIEDAIAKFLMLLSK